MQAGPLLVNKRGARLFYSTIKQLHMDRRTFLSGISTAAILSVAGCSGGGEVSEENSNETDTTAKTATQTATIERSASELILSPDAIVEQVPGEWTPNGTRPPNTEPVGMQSSEIQMFAGESESDELEHGIVVFDTVENAATFMNDERIEEASSEPVADEAFSASSYGTTLLLARYRNLVIQELGTPHVSNLRALVEKQSDVIRV